MTAQPSGTWTLVEHGRLPWDAVVILLAGTTCAWTDIDGPRLAAAPAASPVGATHLWAWNDDRCLRLRVDDGFAYAAELSRHGTGEPVSVAIHPGLRVWGPNVPQAGPIPAEAHGLRWELYDVGGSAPISFVRAVKP